MSSLPLSPCVRVFDIKPSHKPRPRLLTVFHPCDFAGPQLRHALVGHQADVSVFGERRDRGDDQGRDSAADVGDRGVTPSSPSRDEPGL